MNVVEDWTKECNIHFVRLNLGITIIESHNFVAFLLVTTTSKNKSDL